MNRREFRREVAEVRRSPVRREHLMDAHRALAEMAMRGVLSREMQEQFAHARKIIDALHMGEFKAGGNPIGNATRASTAAMPAMGCPHARPMGVPCPHCMGMT